MRHAIDSEQGGCVISGQAFAHRNENKTSLFHFTMAAFMLTDLKGPMLHLSLRFTILTPSKQQQQVCVICEKNSDARDDINLSWVLNKRSRLL